MSAIFRTAIATLFLIAFEKEESLAQFVPSKYEVGINIGTMIYQGDLSQSAWGYTRNLHPALGLTASKTLDDYFSLRVNLMRGRIGADESTYADPAYRRFRNFAFSSSVTEGSAMLVWDLFKKDGEGSKRFSPYFMAGGGLTVLNVKRDWSRFNRTFFDPKSAAFLGLASDTLHKTPGILPVLPVGAGMRYMLTPQFILRAEAIYRITPSDYIDGFKYAGDPSKNDHYYSLTIGISYRFGQDRSSCPKVPK